MNSLSDLNTIRILNLIWRTKKISRVDIAQTLRMNKSTVTRIISRLERKNLVRETVLGESGPQGGRKPILLEINGSFACAGGIQVNTEQVSVCLADMRGTLLFESAQGIDEEAYAKEGFAGALRGGMKLLRKSAEKLHVPLAGIGVGVPGIVDTESRKIIQSIPLLIERPFDISLAAESEETPLFLENDARCCCYAERSCGNVAPSKNFIYVLIDHRRYHPIKDSPKNISIGLGFASKTQIFHGANSCAGEFRSVFWKEGSSSQFSLATQNITNLECGPAREVFEELATNVAFLANTLSVEMVFVGGVERRLSDNVAAMIRRESERLWPYAWNKEKSIESATVYKRAVPYGAAIMVLDNIFKVPNLPAQRTSAAKT